MSDFSLLPLLLIAVIVWSVTNASKKKKNGAAAAQRTAGQASSGAAPAQEIKKSAPAAQTPLRAAIAPTISVSRHDHSGMYDGSMNADSTGEGRDIHDHGFEREIDMPSMHSDEVLNASFRVQEDTVSSAGPLNLNPDSIARAFVLQEVLRRPSERRRR